MEELVSVIIPTYNRKDKIINAIGSVLDQTYKNIEVIVVDDGSTDGTVDVVKKLRDPRVFYISQSNRGPAAARNRGVRESHGEYIAFQDSDDFWKPEKLEIQMHRMRQDDRLDMVYSAFYFCKEGTKVKCPSDSFSIRELEDELFTSLCRRNLITPQTVLIKKKCFEKIGGYVEKLQCLEDWEFAFRIAKQYKIGYVNECLMELNYTSGGVNERWRESAKTLLYILKKHFANDLKNENMIEILMERLAMISPCESMIEWKRELIPQFIQSEQDFNLLLQAQVKNKKQQLYTDTLLKIKDKEKFEMFVKKNGLDEYDRIAIYGAGRMGVYLAEGLHQINIKVAFFIDRNSVCLNGYRVVKPKEINCVPDAILVTIPEGINHVDIELGVKDRIKFVNIYDLESW